MVELRRKLGRVMRSPVAALAGANPMLLGAGLAVLLIVGYSLARGALGTLGGLVTGDNAITQNQTNADGEKTTAYEGAGVAGTVGAVVNSATGGAAASLGESIGGAFYDWWNPAPQFNTGSVSGGW